MPLDPPMGGVDAGEVAGLAQAVASPVRRQQGWSWTRMSRRFSTETIPPAEYPLGDHVFVTGA